jgi:hypothetical protein
MEPIDTRTVYCPLLPSPHSRQLARQAGSYITQHLSPVSLSSSSPTFASTSTHVNATTDHHTSQNNTMLP